MQFTFHVNNLRFMLIPQFFILLDLLQHFISFFFILKMKKNIVAGVIYSLAISLLAVHAEDSTPSVIKRKNRTLGPFGKCEENEEMEYEQGRGKTLGIAKVICREKCPSGYGTTTEECVKGKAYTPHVRLLGIRDDCYKDEDKSKDGPDSRVQCRKRCLMTDGWGWRKDGVCAYKENYEARVFPYTTYAECESRKFEAEFTGSGNGWDFKGCIEKCGDGYKPETVYPGPIAGKQCLWQG